MEVKTYIKKKYQAYNTKDLQNMGIYGSFDTTRRNSSVIRVVSRNENKSGLWNCETRELVVKPIFDWLKEAFNDSWIGKINDTYYVVDNFGNLILKSNHKITHSMYGCELGIYNKCRR